MRDPVLYFAQRRPQRPNCASLSQLTERNNWTQAEVLAFLRCEREPSKHMLREVAVELGRQSRNATPLRFARDNKKPQPKLGQVFVNKLMS